MKPVHFVRWLGESWRLDRDKKAFRRRFVADFRTGQGELVMEAFHWLKVSECPHLFGGSTA